MISKKGSKEIACPASSGQHGGTHIALIKAVAGPEMQVLSLALSTILPHFV